MKKYTGLEYLKIDIASCFGLDKKQFEERIEWVDANINQLESLVDDADSPPMYLAGVMALRHTQEGKAVGYLCSLDACASGPQIMSAITGDPVGAASVGLTGNRRMDFYGEGTREMSRLLGGATVKVERKDFKKASITWFYGSKARPEKLFGKGTAKLRAFLATQYNIAPGACRLKDQLLKSWNPEALKYEWTLPDGFVAICKVMDKQTLRIEIDELKHHKFNHIIDVNVPQKEGKSLAANVVHSIDGMVVREINRRCNYGDEIFEMLSNLMFVTEPEEIDTRNFISVKHRTQKELENMSDNDRWRLKEKLKEIISHDSFEVVCVHDDFRCHPNNMNKLRQTYIDILAEIADSYFIEDILEEITGTRPTLHKIDPNLSAAIREGNYALS